MYKRVLLKTREKIRTRQYVMTIHVEEEMNSDGYTIFDVEKTAITGKIIERQKDHHTGEWKYLIAGSAIDERLTIVVAKLSPTDKLVIITTYLGN